MIFIEIMGIIGTAAFAVSGVLVGIKNRLDLFGVFVLAIITASGGGLIRDVILNDGLPTFFLYPRYLITITVTMVITCIVYKPISRIMFIIKVFDALGLGVFTVLATYKCLVLNLPLIGVIFIAVLTGIGGSILRDILVNEVPLVFRSEIYALASMFGAFVFYFLWQVADVNLNVYLCVTIIFIVRMAAVHFNLNLPELKYMKKDDGQHKP